MTQPTERQVIPATSAATWPAAATQAAAFRWLADHHLDESYRLARAILRNPAAAEDATHDAFEQAWRHWEELRDPARFEHWFYRILVNTCRNYLRRAARTQVRDISLDVRAVDDDLARSDDRQQLAAVVRQLPADHQLVIALRYYRDMSIDDIAAVLGVPPGTVNSRLHYAIKRLSSLLASDRHGGTT